MELDLLSLFGLLCTAVLIGPETPPPLPHLGSYTSLFFTWIFQLVKFDLKRFRPIFVGRKIIDMRSYRKFFLGPQKIGSTNRKSLNILLNLQTAHSRPLEKV
jgi:hypothetical protein